MMKQVRAKADKLKQNQRETIGKNWKIVRKHGPYR